MYGSKDTRICTATTIKPFESTCMDGEMIILSEVRYTEKDKYQISLKCEI